MKKSYIFGGATVMLLASAGLYAAPGAGKMKIDTDGNGAISKSEALARADARFTKMDANNDGTLDQADKAARMKTRFAAMDADKNGAVSEAEFVAAQEARMAKRSDRRQMRMGDRGPNGMKRGGMRMMNAADTNNDKAVTQNEFRNAAEARFARSDTNGDGSISADERKAQRKGKWEQRRMAPAATPDAG